MFAIIKSSIADVNAEFQRKKKQENITKSTEIECGDLSPDSEPQQCSPEWQ